MKESALKNKYSSRKGARKPPLFMLPLHKSIVEKNSTVPARSHLSSISPQRPALSGLPADASSPEASAAALNIKLRAAENLTRGAKTLGQLKGGYLVNNSTLPSMDLSAYKKKQPPPRLAPQKRLLSDPASLALDEAVTLAQDVQNNVSNCADFNLSVPSRDDCTLVGKRDRLATSANSYTSSVPARSNKRSAYDNLFDKSGGAFSSVGTPLCGGEAADQGHTTVSFHKEGNRVPCLSGIDALEQGTSHHGCDKEERYDNDKVSGSFMYNCAVDNVSMVLTDDLLRSWIGLEDLDQVLSTELRFDAKALMGVDRIGIKLPKLTSLKLNRSNIPRIRLLGTRYLALRHLWISNCHVKDLRGIGACAPGLVELYASFNYIDDISPLMDLADTLQVVDLEGNKIAWSVSLSDILCSLHNVLSLNLQGNPVENTPTEGLTHSVPFHHEGGRRDSPTEGKVSTTMGALDFFSCRSSVNSFRKWIQYYMSQLQLLDDIPVHDDSFSNIGTQRIGRSREGAFPSGTTVGKSANDSLSPRSSSEEGAARCQTEQACGLDSLTEKLLKQRSQVFIDPLDAALTEELALLQDCIRSTRFDDALDRAMEMQHRELYTRPSTSAAARQLPDLSSRHNRCNQNRISRLQTSGAQLRQAATAYSNKMPSRRLNEVAECSKTVNAISSLTTGDILTGNAIISLRKRLLYERHQHVPSISASPKASTEGDGSFFPGTVLQAECSESATSARCSSPMTSLAASSHAVLSEAGFDKDEDFFDCGGMDGGDSENEWERLKYVELQCKHRYRPASTSAFFRSHLQEYSNDVVNATTSLSCCSQRLGDGLDKAAEYTSMRELLLKEVARTRVQIAREGAKNLYERQRVSDNEFLPVRSSGLNQRSSSRGVTNSKGVHDPNKPNESLVREIFSVNVLDLTAEEIND